MTADWHVREFEDAKRQRIADRYAERVPRLLWFPLRDVFQLSALETAHLESIFEATEVTIVPDPSEPGSHLLCVLEAKRLMLHFGMRGRMHALGAVGFAGVADEGARLNSTTDPFIDFRVIWPAATAPPDPRASDT